MNITWSMEVCAGEKWFCLEDELEENERVWEESTYGSNQRVHMGEKILQTTKQMHVVFSLVIN